MTSVVYNMDNQENNTRTRELYNFKSIVRVLFN